MNKTLGHWIVGGVLLALSFTLSAAESTVPLEKSPAALCDKASLQRGAALYMHYCAGCHSLSYTRYDAVARGIGLFNEKGELLDALAQKTLNFGGEKLTEAVISAMDKTEAEQWFGKAPPDLTLVARVRGTDWLYSYLRSFYIDPTRPWGVNNLIYPLVGMPHALIGLQGTQKALFKNENTEHPEFLGFEIVQPGLLTPTQYDAAVADIVNFLEFVSEPQKLERKRMGGWVLLFLVVFLVFAFLLKREYWKDVKKGGE